MAAQLGTRSPSAHVVLARCAEPGSAAAQQLAAAGLPFTIVQKACASRGGNRTLVQLETIVRASNERRSRRGADGLAEAGKDTAHGRSQMLKIAHNHGDECSAYLHYIVHAYDTLAPLTMFLQFGAENRTFSPGVNPHTPLALSLDHSSRPLACLVLLTRCGCRPLSGAHTLRPSLRVQANRADTSKRAADCARCRGLHASSRPGLHADRAAQFRRAVACAL